MHPHRSALTCKEHPRLLIDSWPYGLASYFHRCRYNKAEQPSQTQLDIVDLFGVRNAAINEMQLKPILNNMR